MLVDLQNLNFCNALLSAAVPAHFHYSSFVHISYDEIAEGSEKLLYVIYRLHKSKCFK